MRQPEGGKKTNHWLIRHALHTAELHRLCENLYKN